MIPPIARRFVAGETAAEAIDHAVALNGRGMGAILNLLGEHYDADEDVVADAETYHDLVDDIADDGLRACISVKPTQLGLSISEERFQETFAGLIDHATERDVFVWLDMENHTTTEATLSAYERHARASDGNVGVCVQSNLRRTRADLDRVADLPGKVRLVKGAYDPPADLAYRDRDRVDERYRSDIEYAFEHFEDGIAVGSHDEEMVELARSLGEASATPYEVQMLMGVREGYQADLAESVDVWQYAPFGDHWYAYFYRRVMERKENARFAVRALLGR